MGFKGLSAETLGGWRGQIDRAGRWLVRLDEALGDPNSAPGDRVDFTLAFFVNCFAIRDWLQKDRGVAAARLNAFIEATPAMQACRDICNRAKHVSLDDPSVDADFSLHREYAPETATGELWLLLVGTDMSEVSDLAHRCMAHWEQFLAELS